MDINNNDFSLRIVSYNCNSIKSKIDNIRELLSSCDILLCQEVILLQHDECYLSGIDDNFESNFVPSAESEPNHGKGRPSGGRVNFHRLSLNLIFENLCLGHNFSCFNATNGNKSLICLVNIDIPYDKKSMESHIDYQNVLICR